MTDAPKKAPVMTITGGHPVICLFVRKVRQVISHGQVSFPNHR